MKNKKTIRKIIKGFLLTLKLTDGVLILDFFNKNNIHGEVYKKSVINIIKKELLIKYPKLKVERIGKDGIYIFKNE